MAVALKFKRPAWKENRMARILIVNQFYRYRRARREYNRYVKVFGDDMQNPHVAGSFEVKLEAWNAMQASIQIASGDYDYLRP